MNFLFLPPIGWNYPMRQRCHHLAVEFGRLGHGVTYVDVNPDAPAGEVAAGVTVWAPPVGGRRRRLHRAALRTPRLLLGTHPRLLYRTTMDPALAELAASLPGPLVAVIQSPAFAPLVADLKKAKATVVYDRLDDWPHFPNAPEGWAEGDRELIRSADLLWATSPVLLEGIRQEGRAAELVPNGYDPELFRPDREPASEMLPGNPPRVVYAGTLAEWFDDELVTKAAERTPDLSWVIVGRFHDDEDEGIGFSIQLDNWHWIGPRPYEELGALYRHAAVGLIPFRDLPLCRAVDPVKAYEYLASRLPVVATGLPGLADTPGVSLVDSVDDFVAAVRAAVRTPPDWRRVEDYLSRKSWRDRALAALASTAS